MSRAYVIAVTIASVLFAVIGYVAFAARSETGDAVERIIRLEESPCAEDPKGDRCQEIFTSSIRAFDKQTVCLLKARLDIPCTDRPDSTKASRPTPSTGGNDAPTASSDGSALRPTPGGRPADPPAPGGGNGGPAADGPPPGPPPGPAPNPPPPPRPAGDPPAPEPPQSVGGLGIELPGEVNECALLPAACS